MVRLTLSIGGAGREIEEDWPLPLVTYDPRDPASVARAQEIIADHFQLGHPPVLCSETRTRSFSVAVRDFCRALFP